ncbi:NAD(P)-binding protein [Pseudovirgaria hyperparasitica]|uniref:NAD(P)-binding protein n=1 Tax=Pseudovirgaria hyperparasitica TaxID=470096 RepID=A0A6A6WD49_9PEZI|nr:NAD(P)-binding protein [Pseudovirgaria hyperparasitica]KAF2759031.1 NAD(P)-binding protein [Pseudovirgaria hyperparasitica]
MMRIAIAGTGGLALLMASIMQEDTSHQFVLLSRSAKPHLTYQGYQIQVIDYSDISSVKHALMGVDTVISTVTGPEQLQLIEAAVQTRVRRFVPAEYEGTLNSRVRNDPLDRGSSAAQYLLNSYSAWLETTTFTCGILYERFAPGGLIQYNLGLRSGIANEGDYMINIRNNCADSPAYDAAGNMAFVCMISAKDLARFVVRALDMEQWPTELTMRGDRMSVAELTQLVQLLRGRQLRVNWHNPQTLIYEINLAQINGDSAKLWRFNNLLATAEGRFDYESQWLNHQAPDIVPEPFRDWFVRQWAAIP